MREAAEFDPIRVSPLMRAQEFEPEKNAFVADPLAVAPVEFQRPSLRALKTVLDHAAAAIALVLVAPLFAVILLLVRLDGGGAFYRHRRIGLHGVAFDCYKFRTMRVEAARLLASHLAGDPAAAAEWREARTLRHDPRVTWIGRILRRTSLDELPQLINVLRGEMSLVGPRPIVWHEIHRYDAAIRHYISVRPGLTGLWQVSGRGRISYQRRIELDVWYVDHWNILDDFKILLRTVPALLTRDGAAKPLVGERSA